MTGPPYPHSNMCTTLRSLGVLICDKQITWCHYCRSNCHLALTSELECCDVMTHDSVIGTSAAYPRLDTQLPNFILVCLNVFDQLGKTNKQNEENQQ